jgi:hypothetical protein
MLDIKKKINAKVTKTTRGTLTPKSIRCSAKEIELLENFKKKILDMTESDKCSDAKAFNLAIEIANLSDEKAIRKALSNKL